MTTTCAQQKHQAADEPNRDPNRRTNPLLVKSIFQEESDPDDQDQHSDSQEPFLADRQFDRIPLVRAFLPFCLEHSGRKRRWHFSMAGSTALLSAGQGYSDFRFWWRPGQNQV